MVRLVKIKSTFTNIDFKEYVNKNNSYFLATFLEVLFRLTEAQSNHIELNSIINKGLSIKQKRDLICKLNSFQIDGVNIFSIKNNLLVTVHPEFVKNFVINKNQKNFYFNFDLDKIDENWNDQDILIYIYSGFAKKSNLFNNKSFSFIEKRIKLTGKQRKELIEDGYIKLGNSSIYLEYNDNNKYNIIFNKEEQKSFNKIALEKSIKNNIFSINDFIKSSTGRETGKTKDLKFIFDNQDKIGISHFDAFQMISSGYNTFLSGVGGAGKTYLLDKVIKYFNSKNKKVLTIGPTKLTAVNLNGETFHSLLRLRNNIIDWNEAKSYFNENDYPSIFKKINEADVFIIEEFGMVSEAMFETFICAVNEISNIDTKQFIFSGDLGQLNPIASEALYKKYKNKIVNKAVYSNLFNQLDVKTVYFDYNYRTSDSLLEDLLNAVRKGHTYKAYEYIKQAKKVELSQIDNKNITVLTGTNKRVDYFNKMIQSKNNKPDYIFKNHKTTNTNKIPNTIKIKEKDPVIITQTIDKKDYIFYSKKKKAFLKTLPTKPLPNNTIGTFEGNIKGMPVIKLNGKDKYIVIKNLVPYQDYDSLEDSTIKENLVWPLKLAYAFTSHKAQGLTINTQNVFIDLENFSFENQAYTVLSRLTSFNQILISKDISYESIKNNQGFLRSSDISLQNKLLKNNFRNIKKIISNMLKPLMLSPELSLLNFHKVISGNIVRLPIKIEDYKENIQHICPIENISIDNFGNVYVSNRDYNSLLDFLTKNKKFIFSNYYTSEKVVLLYLLFCKGLSKDSLLNIYNSLNNSLTKKYNKLFDKSFEKNKFNYDFIEAFVTDNMMEAQELFENYSDIYNNLEENLLQNFKSSIISEVLLDKGYNPKEYWTSEDNISFYEMFSSVSNKLKEYLLKLKDKNIYWIKKIYKSLKKILKHYQSIKTKSSYIDTEIWQLMLYSENRYTKDSFKARLNVLKNKDKFYNLTDFHEFNKNKFYKKYYDSYFEVETSETLFNEYKEIIVNNLRAFGENISKTHIKEYTMIMRMFLKEYYPI